MDKKKEKHLKNIYEGNYLKILILFKKKHACNPNPMYPQSQIVALGRVALTRKRSSYDTCVHENCASHGLLFLSHAYENCTCIFCIHSCPRKMQTMTSHELCVHMLMRKWKDIQHLVRKTRESQMQQHYV